MFARATIAQQAYQPVTGEQRSQNYPPKHASLLIFETLAPAAPGAKLTVDVLALTSD